ncbi:MAG: OsmC family protein [Bacteroidetes bacterium]|nr:OsmC family protein [Bacteroidota bacterium]
MSDKRHPFKVTTTWTGNRGTGTSAYEAYDRTHIVYVENKVNVNCSSDPLFKGDGTKHNPEDFFVSALSTCHMLWYLHLCADAGVIVSDYTDNAEGILDLNEGKFTEVTLYPHVIVKEADMIEKALALHHEANKKCFIANSCNFKVNHIPSCSI